MKVFFNKEINLNEEIVWERKNGATAPHLKIINQTQQKGELHPNSELNCSLSYLKKGNTVYLFLNPEEENEEGKVGIFLCSDYGFDYVSGKELFFASSEGGYSCAESKMGVYTEGTNIIEYAPKKEDEFYYCLDEDGWKKIEFPQLYGEVIFDEQGFFYFSDLPFNYNNKIFFLDTFVKKKVVINHLGKEINLREGINCECKVMKNNDFFYIVFQPLQKVTDKVYGIFCNYHFAFSGQSYIQYPEQMFGICGEGCEVAFDLVGKKLGESDFVLKLKLMKDGWQDMRFL